MARSAELSGVGPHVKMVRLSTRHSEDCGQDSLVKYSRPSRHVIEMNMVGRPALGEWSGLNHGDLILHIYLVHYQNDLSYFYSTHLWLCHDLCFDATR